MAASLSLLEHMAVLCILYMGQTASECPFDEVQQSPNPAKECLTPIWKSITPLTPRMQV